MQKVKYMQNYTNEERQAAAKRAALRPPTSERMCDLHTKRVSAHKSYKQKNKHTHAPRNESSWAAAEDSFSRVPHKLI